VVFNLTMTSKGRQFDRLGHLYMGDIEVWRTSTAEPTWFGIVFRYGNIGDCMRQSFADIQ